MTSDPACCDRRSSEECRLIESPLGRLHLHIVGAGPAVLFLHGFPEYFGIWRPVLDHLSRSCRAILLDLPGFNRSELADTASADSADMARGVVDALAGFGIRHFGIVAHDLGGMLAWEFAASFRERVKSLALISSPHPADFIRRLWHEAPAERLGYLDRLLDTDPEGYRLDPAALAGLVFPADDGQRPLLEAALARSNIATIRAIYRANIGPAALAKWQAQPPVACRTLALFGPADPFVAPETFSGFASHVSAASEMRELDGGAHFLPISQSAWVARQLDEWLQPNTVQA